MPKKIIELTKTQKSQFNPWIDKWIKIGLNTEEADWDKFEIGVKQCYEFAKIPFPRKIIRVQSPIVGGLAAPIAALIISYIRTGVFNKSSAVRSAVGSGVKSAVESEVESAVGLAVRSAVRSAVDSAVHSAVDSAVSSAVESEVE